MDPTHGHHNPKQDALHDAQPRQSILAKHTNNAVTLSALRKQVRMASDRGLSGRSTPPAPLCCTEKGRVNGLLRIPRPHDTSHL